MKSNVRYLVLAGVFAALTAAGGFLKIPFRPMSITLQTMLAALAGIVLGPKWGAASQLVYLTLGLIGLPIFTMGGGPGYVLQPSFGYLLGFPLTAAVSGWLAGARPTVLRCAVAAAVGIPAGYVIGTPYMGLIGLPIFTMGGGPGYVLQPSFGFLLGFPLTAAVSGWLVGDRPTVPRCALAAAVGILAGYVIGTPYMGLVLNLYLGKGLSVWDVVKTGCLIYLPGECVKVAAAAIVAPPLCKAVRQAQAH